MVVVARRRARKKSPEKPKLNAYPCISVWQRMFTRCCRMQRKAAKVAQAGGTTRSDLAFLDDLDLSHQKRMFVVGYVELGNGAEAARRAGYSPRSARIQASQLLTKPNIKFAVSRARQAVPVSQMNKAKTCFAAGGQSPTHLSPIWSKYVVWHVATFCV